MTSLEAGGGKGATVRRCLDLNVKLLYFLGFWPAEGKEDHNLFYYWRYLLPRVTIIRALYGSVFHMINISIVWGDIPHLAEYVIMLALHLIILNSCFTLLYYRGQLKAVFDDLETLHEPHMVFNDYMRLRLKGTEYFISRLTKIIMTSYSALLIFCVIFQILDGLRKRVIPFRLWMPYSYKESPIFEMTLTFTMTATFTDFFILALCFVTFASPAIITIGQFKLLSYKLINIRDHVEKKINKKRKHLLIEGKGMTLGIGDIDPLRGIPCGHFSLEISKKRSVDDVFGELNDDNLDTLLSEIETLVASDQLTPSGGQINGAKRVGWSPLAKTEEDIEMESYLRHCIKHHQKLLGISKTLGHVFKKVLFQYVLYSATGGLLSLYLTTMAKHLDSKMAAIFILMISLYFQLLCLCLIGGQVSEEAENARDAVYDCDWFGASESFKQSMRIMISRMNRPLVIKAGGLPLSVGTYRLICRAAYYGHMVLNKLILGEKILKSD